VSAGSDSPSPRPGLTRRELVQRGGVAVAGAAALGFTGCGGKAASALPSRGRTEAESDGRRLHWILDMVQNNPGEPLTRTSFNSARKLAGCGYGGQVIDEFRPPTTAVTFDSLDRNIFPAGSSARAWVHDNAQRITARIQEIHAAGLKAIYHTDMILLPTRLVALYAADILDHFGQINLDRPMTRELLRINLDEVFTQFPELDGLMIRTGEVYLQNLPYHTGNDPITRGGSSHLILLDILREELCVKRGRLLFYRTWSFDGFHTDPSYYLSVTDRVAPHPLLTFSIKHTKGDFWRTIPFNPTLAIGRHHQIVEVECQREYEGKSAHPNYIANGVVDGFEELRSSPHPNCLADIADHPTFTGVCTWSRGGGWHGPYITNELWCDLNVFVMSRWAQNVGASEQDVFDQYMTRAGLRGADRARFRQLALLSATGVLHSHYSTVLRIESLTWTRDFYLGGSDQDLKPDFADICDRGLIDRVLTEKAQASALWAEVVRLSRAITSMDSADREYARVSSRYGALLYSIVEHAWGVMLHGVQGDRSGRYDRAAMRAHLREYDLAWEGYGHLRHANPSCATLYVPYSFLQNSDPRKDPTADPDHGMRPSVDRYRDLVRE
jgi:hypothetical protein